MARITSSRGLCVCRPQEHTVEPQEPESLEGKMRPGKLPALTYPTHKVFTGPLSICESTCLLTVLSPLSFQVHDNLILAVGSFCSARGGGSWSLLSFE